MSQGTSPVGSKKVVLAVGGILAVGLVVAILLANGMTLAAKPTIVNSESSSRMSQVLKIKETTVLNSSSPDSNIELRAVKNDRVISILAVNKGQQPVAIKADKWEVSLNGESFSIPENVLAKNRESIPAAASVTLAKFDLSEHEDQLELYPGAYTLDVVGWNWYEKDFGEFTKLGYWEDYVFSANVMVGYDIDLIKSMPNKVLKSDGIQVEIEGSDDLFQVSQSSSKDVIFYLSNTGNEKISAIISSTQFSFWHSDKRFPSAGTLEVAEPYRDVCVVLNPGDKKMVTGYEFATDKWPINGVGGIAQQLGSDTAIPGTYIAHLQVNTHSCTTDTGEQIPGATYSAILALEVEQ